MNSSAYTLTKRFGIFQLRNSGKSVEITHMNYDLHEQILIDDFGTEDEALEWLMDPWNVKEHSYHKFIIQPIYSPMPS